MILAGFLLSIFGTLLLYKNELKSVLFTQIMDRAQSECIAVNPQNPQRGNEYKLVHISGTAQNKINLTDRDFGVVAQDAYRLKRRVEMYQWVETFNQGIGGGRVGHYSYNKRWSDQPIDSRKFKNQGFDNPDIQDWPYRSNAI